MHLLGQRQVPIDQANSNFPGPLYNIYLEKNTKKITNYIIYNTNHLIIQNIIDLKKYIFQIYCINI